MPSYEELYERWFHQTYLWVRRRVPEIDCWDVASDVWMSIRGRLPTLRAGTKFSTWLWKVVRNWIYEYYRKPRPVFNQIVERAHRVAGRMSTAYVNRDGIEYRAVGKSAVLSVNGCLESRQRARELMGRVLRLPPARREIMLRTINGESGREIARALGKKEGTVRASLHRARIQLKEMR